MDAQPSATQPSATHGAKVLFWYLSLFFTLGIVSFATGAIWYQLINKLVPITIAPYGTSPSFSQGMAKTALAAFIVGAPSFFAFMVILRRSIKRMQVTLQRGVRQWVSYLILFIVVATAIGDVITFLTHVLGGDYTLRFVLKCLTILVITSWIFVYFWLDLRSENSLSKSPLPKVMGGVTIAVLVATLIGGLLIIDSPSITRA